MIDFILLNLILFKYEVDLVYTRRLSFCNFVARSIRMLIYFYVNSAAHLRARLIAE
jgi:hypothetical protein